MRISEYKIKILGAFIYAMLLVSSGYAQDEKMPLIASDKTIRIAAEATCIFSIPKVDIKPDQTAVLCWKARIDGDRLRGGQWFSRIEINGIPVGAMHNRLKNRLLNKPLRFRDHRDREQQWYVEGNEGWLTPISPDFAMPGPLTWFFKLGKAAYLYEVDVTDLLDGSKENRLAFQNIMSVKYKQKYGERVFQKTSGDLILSDIYLEFRKGSEDRFPKSAEPFRNSPAASESTWAFHVEPSGEMIVRWGGKEEQARIKSSFARGDGGWITLPSGSDGEKMVKLSASAWRLRLETPLYHIERLVRKESDRIRISDRFISKEINKTVVIIPRYEIQIAANRFGTAWLGGDPDPSRNNVSCPYNPTLFVPMNGVGIGLAVEDDVMRLQGKFSYDAQSGIAAVQSEELVISKEGGGEYIVEISLYPTNDAEYWGFINGVRRDWKISATMPGTIWFTYPENINLSDDFATAGFIKNNNVAYVIFWADLSFKYHPELKPPFFIMGAARLDDRAKYIQDTYEEDVGKAINRLHRLAPAAKILLYVHSHVCSIFDESGFEPMRDSLITDNGNNPIRRHSSDKRFYPLYLVYPTEKNGYGKRFTNLVDHLLGLGADGIYWDEMSAATREVKYTYSEFDGYSADVDTTSQTMKKEKGLVGLLSARYKINLVNRLIAQGLVVHANGAPEIMAMNRLPITRMVETPDTSLRVSELHLTTPYAYTWSPFSMDQFRDRLLNGALCFRPAKGALFIAQAYPVTPERLGEGFITGPERIVAAKSGNYGWDGSWQADFMAYDSSGKVISQKTMQGNGKQNITIPIGGIAIITKRH